MTEAERKDKDYRFISHPMEWPRWPVLPVKNRDSTKFHTDEYCGLIHASDPTTIHFANMFSLSDLKPKPKTWTEALAGAKQKKYASIDDLVAEYTVD